jgi:hypothetical protein
MTTVAQFQVNLFCADVDACLAFYTRLGLTEAFRAPADGPVQHVELEAAGVRIGLTSAEVANDLVNLGVAARTTPSTEIVFWCADRFPRRPLALRLAPRPGCPPTQTRAESSPRVLTARTFECRRRSRETLPIACRIHRTSFVA